MHSITQLAKITLVVLSVSVGIEAILKVSFDCQLSGVKYDENLGWRYKDNYTGNIIKKVDNDKTITTKVSFNNDGFRDVNHNTDKEINTKRIMILGDSYTAGTAIPEDKIFTSIFENKLNENPSNKYKFDVMNVAVAAWSTDQQYIYLAQEGLRYRPDYIILMMAPNDIRESDGKGFFKLDKAGRLIRGKPIHLPASTRFLWYLSCRLCTFQVFQYLIGTNYGSFKNISYYFPSAYAVGNENFNEKHLFLKEDIEEVKDAKNLFVHLLSEIQLICTKNNIKLMLSLIPTKMQFDGTLDNSKYDSGKISRFLSNIASNKNIPFMDPYETQKENPHVLDIYISWEYHLNENGHKFVANELLDFFNNNR